MIRQKTIGSKVLLAACLALNQIGEGSSPSGPTRNKHGSSRGEDSAFVMRQRGFESHPVLFVFRESCFQGILKAFSGKPDGSNVFENTS